MNRHLFTGAAAAAGVLMLSAGAQAAIIIGNLATAINGTQSNFDSANTKGISFTPSLNATATSLQLMLSKNSGAPTTSNVVAKIYKNSTTGSFLTTPAVGTFTYTPAAVSLASTATAYTFTATSTVSLTAGTNYWVFLEGINSDKVAWYSSTAVGSYTGSFTNGSVAARFGVSPDSLNGGTSTNYNIFELDGTVPEPASMALLSCGCAGMALRRQRVSGR